MRCRRLRRAAPGRRPASATSAARRSARPAAGRRAAACRATDASPAIGGSSPPSSPISSTTSGSSPSTTPRTSGGGSTRRSRAMVDAIEGFDGTREKFIGDAVFAVFGWPRRPRRRRAAGHPLRARDPRGAARASTTGRRAAPGPDRDRDRRGRRRARAACRRALDWSLTGPAVTTAARIQALARARRDPPRRGDASGPRGRASRRGRWAAAPARPVPAVRIGAAARRGRLPAVAPADRAGSSAGRPSGAGCGRVLDDLASRPRRDESSSRARPGSASRGSWPTSQTEARGGRLRLDVGRQRVVRRGASRTASPGRSPRRSPTSTAPTPGSMTRRLLFTADVAPADARRWAGGDRGDRPRRRVLGLGGGGAASSRPTRPRSPARSGRAGRPLRRAADRAHGPRMIVIDDLHWLDPSSAGIFEELVGVAADAAARRSSSAAGPARPAMRRDWRSRRAHRARRARRGRDRRARAARRRRGGRPGRCPAAPRANGRQPAVHHRDGAGDPRRRRDRAPPAGSRRRRTGPDGLP